MSHACAGLLLTLLLLGWAPVSFGQTAAPSRSADPLRVSSAVAPETVTVGDRFRTVLQVVAPAGATVEFGEAAVTDTLQPVDSVRIIPSRAGEPPTAAYTLAAWVAGVPLRSQVSVRVALADGSAATYLVPLRLPVVRSVLPEGDREIRPRPARGLLELAAPERPWWWLPLLLAALAMALALGGWLVWRRRGHEAPILAVDPRTRALAALHRVAQARDQGAAAATVYPAATRIVREYLAELNAAWGSDLTTSELLARVSTSRAYASAQERLAALLRHADQVKFARHQPPPEEVAEFLAGARDWVARFPEPTVSPSAREAA